ncbi:MAG: hypothetical protein Q9197_003589 [Variospora fuerteventurae]
MTASIEIIVAQLFLAMLAFNIPAYQIQRWHVFLSYQVLNVITTVYNLLALKRTPWTHNIGLKSKKTRDTKTVHLSSRFFGFVLCNQHYKSRPSAAKAIELSSMAQLHQRYRLEF